MENNQAKPKKATKPEKIAAQPAVTKVNGNKTFMAKAEDIERAWYVIDAADVVLGRLASKTATILRGKNKAIYTPNVDTGDFVIIVNCAKVKLTGKKLEQKFHTYHTGYVGGLKSVQYKKLMAESPDKVVMLAVKGMLPKNSLGRKMLKKLRVYTGAEHNQTAQQPIELKF